MAAILHTKTGADTQTHGCSTRTHTHTVGFLDSVPCGICLLNAFLWNTFIIYGEIGSDSTAHPPFPSSHPLPPCLSAALILPITLQLLWVRRWQSNKGTFFIYKKLFLMCWIDWTWTMSEIKMHWCHSYFLCLSHSRSISFSLQGFQGKWCY